jgi:hypothetical protein
LDAFSLTLYGFELLAPEFIPGRTGRSRVIRQQDPFVAKANNGLNAKAIGSESGPIVFALKEV